MATTQPYEVLARFNDGQWHIHARQLITLDDGTVIEGKPTPLAGLTDPAFVAIAATINATNAARIAELTQSLADKTAEWETLKDEKAALTAERDSLQARIDELTAIAEQPICTNFQIRAWLITKFGLGIIDKVTAMIASIPDATQRLLANQQWEYANNVLRDNPFVEQIAAALGMKSDEMDAAYLEASKIV